MKIQTTSIYIISLLLLATACNRDNDYTVIEEDKITEEGMLIEGNLNGRVVNEDLLPIDLAKVEVSGKTTETDENGFFRIENVSISDLGSLVEITKEGYFDGYKFTYVEPGENSYLKVKLINDQIDKSFASSGAGEVELNGGAKISFPANAIAKQDGSPYSGTVNVQGHWYDPTSDELGYSMPGDLRGIDTEEAKVQLATYGMMAVELTGTNGETLLLSDGMTARLSFPLPSTLSAPDSMPLWYFDEVSGYWKEEGQAVKQNNTLVAEVSHFSFWNCDVPFPYVNIKGRLISEDGVPLANQLVTIRDNNSNTSGTDITNESGIFQGKVPQGVPLDIILQGCSITSVTDIGILNEDQNLGDIVVEGINAYTLTGNLVDCNSEPVINGYLFIKATNSSSSVTNDLPTIAVPNSDGLVETVLFLCDDTDLELIGIDRDIIKQSNPAIVEVNQGIIDFGELKACEVLEDQFISFGRQSAEATFTDALVYIVDDTYIHIYAVDEDDPNIHISIMYYKDPTETECFQAYVSFVGTENGPLTFRTENSGYFFPPTSSVSEAGDIITESTTDGFYLDFALQIDKKVKSASIQGKAWYDENQDGIQNPTEPEAENIKFIIWNTRFGKGETPVSNINGIFKQEILIPGIEYYLQFDTPLQGQPTIANQGGDENRDSDFIPALGSKYITENFLLSEDEHKTDIGLGILPGSESGMQCTIAHDCCPLTGANVSIQGGMPPYSVWVYDKDGAYYNTSESSTDFFIPITDDGVYYITVRDTEFELCDTRDFVIGDNLNSINGQVWIDSPSGIANTLDDNDTERLSDLELNLVDSQGSTIETQYTDAFGRYLFKNVPGDNYRIQVTVPAGYELLQQGDSNDRNKSHIDPLTALSNEETVGDYDDTNPVIPHIINIGLK